jgi:hypothetical protein
MKSLFFCIILLIGTINIRCNSNMNSTKENPNNSLVKFRDINYFSLEGVGILDTNQEEYPYVVIQHSKEDDHRPKRITVNASYSSNAKVVLEYNLQRDNKTYLCEKYTEANTTYLFVTGSESYDYFFYTPDSISYLLTCEHRTGNKIKSFRAKNMFTIKKDNHLTYDFINTIDTNLLDYNQKYITQTNDYLIVSGDSSESEYYRTYGRSYFWVEWFGYHAQIPQPDKKR